jgi:hypothetical protein
MLNYPTGLTVAVDQPVVGRDISAVVRGAFADSEQQDVARQRTRGVDLLAVLLEPEVHARLGPVEMPGGRVVERYRYRAEEALGDAPDEADAVAPYALQSRLMVPGRAEPSARFRDHVLSRERHLQSFTG